MKKNVEGEVLDALRLYQSQALSSGPGVFEGGGLRMPLLSLSRQAVVESRARHARRQDTTPHHIPATLVEHPYHEWASFPVLVGNSRCMRPESKSWWSPPFSPS
jgi:hypothetical protein